MQQNRLVLLFSFTIACSPGSIVDPSGNNTDGGINSGDGGGGGGGNETLISVQGGTFAAMAGYTGISGRAQLVIDKQNQSQASISVAGLVANTAYTAHIHALPCALQGGGHYKFDPLLLDPVDPTLAIESNEVWLKMTSDADGNARSVVVVPKVLRGDAQSIVVHDPVSKAKMACADLATKDATITKTGTLTPFASAETADQTIAGTVTQIVDSTGTKVNVSVTGLDPAATYGSHVHAFPCDVDTGGGHYKIDPASTVTDPALIEANELWPKITTPAADGTASDMLVSTHIARGDAQSVVIHRVVSADAKPKVACANLVRTQNSPLATTGALTIFTDFTATFGAATGTATMTRSLTGKTSVNLQASGLGANTAFMAHVHDLPCAVKSGGGHYKIDTAVVDAQEDNEIWLMLMADANGSVNVSVESPDLARADAQSIVIHNQDSARVGCFDLK